MTSQVEIANMALDLIGTRSTIASLTENSVEAAAVSRHWSNALDCVLRACHWNFARKQISLTLLKDGTQGQSVPTPWLYEYAYPTDCVLLRYLMPLIQTSPTTVVGTASPMTAYGPPVPFVLSSDNDANGNPIQVILTNQPQAQAVYTWRNTLTTMFDAQFVNALSAYLGSRICKALTGDMAMMKAAFEIASELTIKAQASNGNEGLTVIDSTPDWMRVRGYCSDWAYPNGGMFSYGPQALTLVS